MTLQSSGDIENRRFIVIWCETGCHTWAVNSIDGFLDYVHQLWMFGKMFRHNLPANEKRRFDRGLREAMLRNTREHVVQCLLEDGFLYAECVDCRAKRTREYYEKVGVETVQVGEFFFAKALYEEKKDEIEKNHQQFELVQRSRS